MCEASAAPARAHQVAQQQGGTRLKPLVSSSSSSSSSLTLLIHCWVREICSSIPTQTHCCDFWTSQIWVSLRAVPTARKEPRPDQATEHTLSGCCGVPSSHSLCTRDVAADHRYTHVPAYNSLAFAELQASAWLRVQLAQLVPPTTGTHTWRASQIGFARGSAFSSAGFGSGEKRSRLGLDAVFLGLQS